MKQQLDQGKNEKRGAAQYYTDRRIESPESHRHQYRQTQGTICTRRNTLVRPGESDGHRARGMRTSTTDSVLVDFVLDPRFVDDKQYPNQWQSGHQDKLGNTVYDPAQAVFRRRRLHEGHKAAGPARFAKMSPERVFIEYHLVFDEPNGWFGGGNNLIAKLPNRFEADVRKFREDLKKYEERMAGGKGALAPTAGESVCQGVQTAANQ